METKILLSEADLPKAWYNLAADLPSPPLPPLGPNGQPVTPEQMRPIFPDNLIEQEMSVKRWVTIPDEILAILKRWRPTPLRRAIHLEAALQTPAKIFYKDESVSPAGSHKPNTAVAQAWYNKQAGITHLTTETGAGQWGSALSFASKLVGLHCKVFMVRISFDQKPFRKMMMSVWDGECIASPSDTTEIGRRILKEMPDTPGSLGIAISEAIETAVKDLTQKTKYSLGSVLNHVMLHQTIIGLEAKEQLNKAGIEHPDIVIGCAGGGSNFAGLAFPFLNDKLHGADIAIYPVEPKACPTLTRSPFVYDHGDVAKMTPLLAMHSLGHTFIPEPIHAGGLRYHGMAPLVSHAVDQGWLLPKSYGQMECYEAALLWARTEGFIPAPETSHAIAGAIAEAKQATEEGKERVILFNYSGHGLMDLAGYDKFLSGELVHHEPDEETLREYQRILANHPSAKVE